MRGSLFATGAVLATVMVPSASAQPDLITSRTSSGVAYATTGSGPAIVFIHAFSLDRRMWRDQVSALRDRYKVITLDARAHGATPVPEGTYSSVEDVAAVLETLGVERAVLVGLSSGSTISIDFALAHPDKVSGLVLAAPWVSGYRPTGSFEWMTPIVEAARSGDAARAATLFAASRLMWVPDSAGRAFVQEMVADNAALWRMPGNPERPLEPPAIGRLRAVRAPVMIVVGDRDTEDSKRVARLLESSLAVVERHDVPNAGHLVSLAAPGVFTFLLEEFLARVADVPPGGRDPRSP